MQIKIHLSIFTGWEIQGLSQTSYLNLVQEPLLFYSCGYAGLRFQRSKESAFGNLEAIDNLLNRHLARVAQLQSMVAKLSGQQEVIVDHTGNLVPWQKIRKHIKLEKRGREASLDHKFARYGKVSLAPSSVKFQLGNLEGGLRQEGQDA